MKKSKLEQKLMHKSLGFMLDDSAKLIDIVLEDSGNDEIKAKFKNVCAMLSEPLIKRLEDTLGLLGISKREFLELAIIDALDKADLAIEESGLKNYLQDMALHQESQKLHEAK
jgi:hypothetical protein